MAMMHTNFRSACSVKGHPPDSPKWEPTLTLARCHKRGTNTPNFRSEKLIFRVLNRLFETATKTTRESTGTKSRRACTPSRVTRLTRLIKLSSSKIQFQEIYVLAFGKNGAKTSWPNPTSKASGAAAARPSCMLLCGSLPFQSRRTCSPFSSAKSYKASQASCVMGATQPPPPLAMHP